MSSAITQVGRVLVPVADQESALRDYVALGFEVRIDAEFAPGQRWLEVAPLGAVTTIALVGLQMAPAGVEISFASRDVESDRVTLADRGFAVGEVLRMGDGVPPMFTFADGDGNAFRVVEES